MTKITLYYNYLRIKAFFRLNDYVKALIVFTLFCTFWASAIMIKFDLTKLVIVPLLMYIVFLFIANYITRRYDKK